MFKFFLKTPVFAPEGEGTGARPSEQDIMASMFEDAPKEEPKKKVASQSPALIGGADEDAGDEQDGEAESSADHARRPAQEDSDDADDDAGDDGNEPDDDGESHDDDDPLDGIFDADSQERDDQGEDDAFDASTLGDDTKLSVTVDGEEREVTLGDLKRRYAGESAIEGRLQQATEARQASVQTYQRLHQLSTAVLQEFGQMMFQRTVPEPPLELRATDPIKYLTQRDLYDRETAALSGMQQKLAGLVEQVDKAHEANLAQVRQQASQQLKQIMPVLADPIRGPKVRDALIEAAREVGYTTEQIAQCTDPLMFKVMALAARELRRQKGVKVEKAKEPTRTLKAVGSSNRAVTPKAVREDKTNLSRARKTGSEADIIASMMVSQPRKRDTRR